MDLRRRNIDCILSYRGQWTCVAAILIVYCHIGETVDLRRHNIDCILSYRGDYGPASPYIYCILPFREDSGPALPQY